MNNIRRIVSIAAWLICLSAYKGYTQAGITVSPSRIYFIPGQLSSQKISLTNPNQFRPLEIGLTLFDWKYDSLGNNIVSQLGTLPNTLGNFIKIPQGTYFTLKPGETKDIDVVCNVPANDTAAYRTAMLYVTQLNPDIAKDEKGASFKVTVRIGIKFYQTVNASPNIDMEVSNFYTVKDSSGITKNVDLVMDNTGNLWTSGKISYELLDNNTGKKTEMPDLEFYSLPGDRRIATAKLPDNLPKGEYTITAVIRYNDNKGIKIADLKMEL